MRIFFMIVSILPVVRPFEECYRGKCCPGYYDNDCTQESSKTCSKSNVLPSLEMRMRGYTAGDGETMMCDYNLSPGWYSLCGHILSTQPGSCGSTFSWWMNDTVPDSGTAEVLLCAYHDQDNSCIDTMAINVTKCGDNSYVFHLPSLQSCPEVYCIEPVEKSANKAPLCENMTKDYCSDAKTIPLLDKRTSTYESESGGTPMCDMYLQPGWYKACEHLLATNPVQCSVFSWYATEALPTSGTGEVNLCMFNNGTCLENKTITVSNCQDGSYAYNLNGTESCPEAHCFEKDQRLEAPLCESTITEIEELCLAAIDIPSAEKRVSGYILNGGETSLCDYNLQPGWYSTCGYVLSSQNEGCGTVFFWYRKDDLPDKGYGEVTVCLSNTSCSQNKTINAARCQDGSYIFNLTPMDACPEAYCLEPPAEIPTENMLCKGTIREIEENCTNAKVLYSMDQRLSGYVTPEGGHALCDYRLTPGWYSLCGNVLAYTNELCGTVFSWIATDSLPVSGTTDVSLCQIATAGDVCINTMTVRVARCLDGEYIFYLNDLSNCPEAYCVEKPVGVNQEGALCSEKRQGGKEGDYCATDNDCLQDLECSRNLCSCRQGFSSANGVCLQDGAIGGTCIYNSDCFDEYAECKERKCTCESDMNWDGTICRTTKSAGDVCLSSADCQDDTATCVGGTCLCKRQFLHVDGKCIKDGNVGGICSFGGTCTDLNSNCVVDMETECSDPKCKHHQWCRCINGFVYSNGECVKDAKPSTPWQLIVVCAIIGSVACVLAGIVCGVLICRKKVARNLQTLKPYGTSCANAKKYFVNKIEYPERISPPPPYTESHQTRMTGIGHIDKRQDLGTSPSEKI